jgi:hypothetical protein
MTPFRRDLASIALLSAAALAAACSDSSDRIGATALCQKRVEESLVRCFAVASEAIRRCFDTTGEPCAADDAGTQEAIDLVADEVAAACRDDATVVATGYGPRFTVATLAGRIQESCRAESAALAARTFGGPQGAAFAAADAAGRACLDAAHESGQSLLARGITLRGDCIDPARGPCDPAFFDRYLPEGRQMAIDAIEAACPALAELIAVDPERYVERTELQAQCATAIAYPDTTGAPVDCGPREAVATLPRGEWSQVVLDEGVFGTRCGDGSPYAFQVWLAPEGSPVENVVVGMEGGGVCVFEDDCASRPADLFEALSDPPFELGPLSNDPSFNPFASWTKVFLPYCTQDVFIGGGATSNWPSVTVYRFGSVNVRVALQYVRDVIWRILDAETPEGYRPDRMRVLFGGFSAGGFGTLYNYHYVLDDLQWAHTAAYPDAALALDNGQVFGLRGLGGIVISETAPIGWGALSFLPPYCFSSDCGIGPLILETSAPRLEAVPEQQFLVLSNQVDGVQVGTTFFPDTESWINALRTAYCETRGLRGVHYYMPAILESTHVISPRPQIYAGEVDGAVLRDWLAGAFADPAAVRDRVEEGTLVEDFPGVMRFPCPVAP